MTIDTGFHLKNYKSFGPTGVRLTNIKPINVIVGRNNIGKSALLHSLDFLCSDWTNHNNIASSIEITQPLDEVALMQVFNPRTTRDNLGGSHWEDHVENFIGASFTWKEIYENLSQFIRVDANVTKIEKEYISKIRPTSSLRSFIHIKLDADRDIIPESIDESISLSSGGGGATRIIHKYLQHVGFDRSLIQVDLLTALNQIFSPDIEFNEIATRFHSESNRWEIFLGEASKGPIALSASGSGLKTVILTLLNLLVRPDFEKKPIGSYIFSLEELENNLHPALQRNLFIYLEAFAIENKCHLFLTTHSNVAIDIFGHSEHSQILHIMRGEDGIIGNTYTGDAVGHGVLDDLGVRASDLLQANGLIWVEGPSDRVFLKKWIDLWSDNELSEGRHYQFVFYGGSVLANIDARLPDNDTREAIAAFKINRNFAFICDSDRRNSSGSLKPRVAQLIKEVADTRAVVWVTCCKEIENYIPKEAFEAVHGKVELAQIGEYEAIQDYLRKNKISSAKEYTKKHSKAFAYATHLTKKNLSFRPELEEQVTALVMKIRAWNS
ncbi:ATP-binding protein [Pseudomonas sp. MAFF 302030]|uniref:ATP-binding protein n=1 Tax=Pseudomonas morbosilactucae TaxID=2938197 RepID=A0A9X1Z026_9PSED|nr:ATP-binding protein [Pseudomonas morbosilactucae]MCK9801468.1 ATP-binding protein [Pseudomonas morbosilactucae]